MTPEKTRQLITELRRACRPASEINAQLIDLYYGDYAGRARCCHDLRWFRLLCKAAETDAISADVSACLVEVTPPAGSSPSTQACAGQLSVRLGRLLRREALAAGEDPKDIKLRRMRLATRRIVDASFDAMEPIGEVGSLLARRYQALVAGRDIPMSERSIIAELRHLVETAELTGDPAQISLLLAPRSNDPHWRRVIRRQLEVRLIRILEAEGVIDPLEDRNARARTARIISAAPHETQRTLRLWAQWRAAKVAPLAIKDEIKRLVELEHVIAHHGGQDHSGLLTLWLRRLTRQVVNCTCHPQWKLFDDYKCRRCGATVEEFGTKPSISEKRMRQYRSEGARYLEFRRAGATTRLFA